MTVIHFKTSSLGLPRVVFTCTVPTIIFQPVEFLLRWHLQKLLNFWLYVLNISPGKRNWLQGPREEFDTEPLHTCSETNSSLCPHTQTHSHTTSKADNLPGPPSSKDRIIKSMILCTNSITCRGRKTLDRPFQTSVVAPFPIAITDVVTLPSCDMHYLSCHRWAFCQFWCTVKNQTIHPSEFLWVVIVGSGTALTLMAFLLVNTRRSFLCHS